ncbi:homoserine kinase [Flavobacterium azooxidireducens]|uniref:Homoserine kinase n=1 Tax=Flavobacterium azooxidireducens TaxID=1871076 RepID=A0ABY4KDK2_9FLAO|nr:homoserine kinase [Flavobacterium azooxidireducens]UPQ78876.1 homoserine kinase [Flavobacterium azooxidireducens]
MNQIKIFCPATVANLSCGFDVLGLCLEGIGDEMIIRKSDEKGIRITKITGADLPLETNKNVAGVAGLAMLNHLDLEFGFEIEIHKKIKAGSGIGSSAASAAGVVVGINELLGNPLHRKDLIPFAMEGEFLASGSYHADNVAPAILGRFTLVRGYDPLEVIKINSPNDLYVTIIHPHIEVKTSEARKVLPKEIPLKTAITQWGNLGGFISGLYTENYALMGRCLQDVVAEPYRKNLIPEFDNVKKVALENGALGCGISGSGPSIYALSKGIQTAENVGDKIKEVYSKTGIEYAIYVSKVCDFGVRVI